MKDSKIFTKGMKGMKRSEMREDEKRNKVVKHVKMFPRCWTDSKFVAFLLK